MLHPLVLLQTINLQILAAVPGNQKYFKCQERTTVAAATCIGHHETSSEKIKVIFQF